jgi:hypothetical protein
MAKQLKVVRHFPERKGVYILRNGIWIDEPFLWSIDGAMVIIGKGRPWDADREWAFVMAPTMREGRGIESRSGYAFKGELGGEFELINRGRCALTELGYWGAGRAFQKEGKTGVS